MLTVLSERNPARLLVARVFPWLRNANDECIDEGAEESRESAQKGLIGPSWEQSLPPHDELYAALRHMDNTEWNAETLSLFLNSALPERDIIVVSNREPHIHTRTDQGVITQRPASGLVTALESLVAACSGTWIAHGSGSADKETADDAGRLSVPADQPTYTLRRIWLNNEEEAGYYQKLSNEGLWPLCHVAHVRPIFKSEDWEQYVAVNQRFADAVIHEAHTKTPVVLVQDYHLALVPKLIRAKLPEATILTFWHIPWPSADMFAICPWRQEIMEGLLGSTVVGFQIEQHRDNFLHAVANTLPVAVKVKEKSSSIGLGTRTVLARHYPISIEWPAENALHWPTVRACRSEVFRNYALQPDQLLLLGVDRLDYTKGILERLQAFENLLCRYPALAGKAVLLQIGAPTRATVEQYQWYAEKVIALVKRINDRFSRAEYVPVILKLESHDADALNRFYRACDVCLVTSLHDGMNLVAKEFIAARDDEQGALILSEFAGASIELGDALIVNPYHIENMADTILRALTMAPVEKKSRMRKMRAIVKSANVYRWAASILHDGLRHRHATLSAVSRAAMAENAIWCA